MTDRSRRLYGDRGFDPEQFCARLERLLARAGANLRAVDGDLDQLHQSFADQRRHALRQGPIEDLDAFDPEVGNPVIVQRYASRQPSIGCVALCASRSSSRAEPTPSTVA